MSDPSNNQAREAEAPHRGTGPGPGGAERAARLASSQDGVVGRMRRGRTAVRGAALLTVSVLLLCGGASAAPSCEGTYAATVLRPLPERMVVDLDIRDRSPRNLMLAERFLRGIREAGIGVGQDGNVLLHVSTSRLGETSSGATR